MTEDNLPTVSSSDSVASTDSSTAKRRKKRKWDVPAEPLVAAGLALPGNLPLPDKGSLVGVTLPGLAVVSNSPVMSPLAANGATLLPGLQALALQNAAALAQKLNMPKVQDELIAREIVINDADSSTRYKLTKRQTQEEIQKCTGAVVITRGKYRPPNAPGDGEKPLYLHISAGSHLETTVERIKAVDCASAMVEEMLKQVKPFSTCVHLGFEADPSFNIVSRIRGPNDQYINHIMNETGATVLLRGRGSGSESAKDEEGQQPLHLFLSTSDLKSLEQAKLLAENLLDTITAECGASRISSNKVYGAVAPPQLSTHVDSSLNEAKTSNIVAASPPLSSIGSRPAFPLVIPASLTGAVPHGIVSHTVGLMSCVQPQPSTCYSQPPLTGGTNYNGYAGIYPQATPMQQVALALRQSASPITATIAPVTTRAKTAPHASAESSAEMDKRPPQRRKFQELPAGGKVISCSQQGSYPQKPSELTSDVGVRGVPLPPAKNSVQPSSSGVMMPPRIDLVHRSSNGVLPPPLPPPPKSMPPPPPPKSMPPPPPPKSMPPPPPPPKFNSAPRKVHESKHTPNRLKAESVPDTLVKLMEYGDDDDDDDEESVETKESSLGRNSMARAAPKPFWAV